MRRTGLLAPALSLILALVLVAGVLPPAASARDHAPQPSPEHNVLWAHRDLVDDRFHHHMSTDLNETEPFNPGSDDPGESWNWTITLRPALNHTLILDGNASVAFQVYMGGSRYFGAVEVSTALRSGDAVVARGDAQEHVFTPSGITVEDLVDLVEPYPLLEWEAPVQLDLLEPGKELVWTIHATGQFTAIYVGMSPTRGNSHLVLPIIATEAPPPGTPEDDEEEMITPGPGMLLFLAGLAGVAAGAASRRARPPRV